MNTLLNALINGERISSEDLEQLGHHLVVQLQQTLGVDALSVLDSRIDETGAFPGIFCN